MFQKVKSNLFGRQRSERLLDQNYIVTPVVMIVSGVWSGADGPLFYPASELTRNAQAWNGMPLTLGHPPSSARTPDMIDEYAIGNVYSVRIDNDRLVGEAWFNIEQVKARSSQLLSLLESNDPIEVSTGLFLDKHSSKGTSRGNEYKTVARNYRPDHLAILLDRQGACSVKDGCGILAYNWSEESKWLAEKASAIANCQCEPRTTIQPLLKPIMNFADTKPTPVVTRSRLLEVANERGVEPLRMPSLF